MKKITINHLAKMEGHASFVGKIEASGRVKEALVDTEEGARLIEGILIGRHFSEAKTVTSRICGVCPVVHYLTAVQAMERALDITPRDIDVQLRKLMESAQILYSHSIHLFFLSLPDFLDYDDTVKMASKYAPETQLALNLRKYSVDLQRIAGGRTIHPLTPEEGGMKRYPLKGELQSLLDQTDEMIEITLKLAEFFGKLEYPVFIRKTEYIALGHPKEYTYYQGHIISSEGLNISPQQFAHDVEEIDRAYNLVKRTHWQGEPYFLGALARLNLHHGQLNPLAKKFFKQCSIKFPSYNSFHNVMAQAIEQIHFAEECKRLLKEVISRYKECDSAKNIKYRIKAGKGVGAIEAPRGTLYHYYELDKNGYIKDCNIISPTAQFMANLEADLKQYIGRQHDPKKIKQLIRAYDPCISCATH